MLLSVVIIKYVESPQQQENKNNINLLTFVFLMLLFFSPFHSPPQPHRDILHLLFLFPVLSSSSQSPRLPLLPLKVILEHCLPDLPSCSFPFFFDSSSPMFSLPPPPYPPFLPHFSPLLDSMHPFSSSYLICNDSNSYPIHAIHECLTYCRCHFLHKNYFTGSVIFINVAFIMSSPEKNQDCVPKI